MKHKPTFYFLLIPEFSLMSLTSAIEPLRVANSALGEISHKIVLVSVDGEPIEASNERSLDVDTDLESVVTNIGRDDHFFIVSSFNPERYAQKLITSSLREIRKIGTQLYSLEAGLFFLGLAGLLAKKKVAAHWMGQHYFSSIFPHTEFSNQDFMRDGRVITCSGGLAPFGLIMAVVGERYGDEVKLEVAKRLNYVRPDVDQQIFRKEQEEPTVKPNRKKRKIADLCRYLEAHISDPQTISNIALANRLSRRQLDRLFVSEFGVSAREYYANLRLEKARYLLRRSSMTATDIADACGYSSYNYFYRCYRQKYETSPSKDRDAIYEWPGSQTFSAQVEG